MRGTGLVTGAASGLGYEFCRLMAADTFDLILVDKDREGLQKVQKELAREYGVRIDIHVADLGNQGAVDDLYAKVCDTQIDVLINNAGFGLYGFFSDTDWEKEQAMLNLHVMTVTRLTKLLLGRMIEQGSGRILNVSSLAAFQPGPLMSIYYASKAYILSFSEALANELKGTGVSVTVLAPGWFRTNFQKTTALHSGVEESRARLHTATAEKVARKGYRAMMKGRALIVPGFTNKLMSMAPRLLPRRTMTYVIRTIQEGLRD